VQDRLASRELSYLNELGFTPRRRMCCSGMTAQLEAASLGMGLMMAPPALYRLRRVKVVWNLLRECAESHPDLFVADDAGA